MAFCTRVLHTGIQGADVVVIAFPVHQTTAFDGLILADGVLAEIGGADVLIVTEDIIDTTFHVRDKDLTSVVLTLVDGTGIFILAFFVGGTAPLKGSMFAFFVGTGVNGAGIGIDTLVIRCALWRLRTITQHP